MGGADRRYSGGQARRRHLLLSFFDYLTEHWSNVKTTNAITGGEFNLVDDYIAAWTLVGRRTRRSTVQAARSFCAKVERAGRFERMTRARLLDAVRKARAFASWLMVTGQLRVDADVLGRLDLRLGGVAVNHCPGAHRWFVDACAQIATRPADVSIQWNALVKITAITGAAPDQVGDTD